METLIEAQENLMRTLGLPLAFEYLDDDQLMRIEDVLSYEMQTHGINEEGNGLNNLRRTMPFMHNSAAGLATIASRTKRP